MTSERLSETLRAELHAILDNDGKPFDLQVARHVYDFAIAAKDLLTVSVKSVEDALRVVADNKGPMETLSGVNDPQPPEQVSETFGARMLRELLATLPAMLRKNNEDMQALVGAIADARAHGMHDLAVKLEQRLLGTPLEPPKITHAEVVHDSYEHGFIDGSMKDNFDRGTINGHVGRDPGTWSPAYREGYEAGCARRQARSTFGATPAAGGGELDPSIRTQPTSAFLVPADAGLEDLGKIASDNNEDSGLLQEAAAAAVAAAGSRLSPVIKNSVVLDALAQKKQTEANVPQLIASNGVES